MTRKTGRHRPAPVRRTPTEKLATPATRPGPGALAGSCTAQATPLLTALLTEGVQHHQASRLADAEAAYRQVLQLQPNQPDALHLLGVLAHQAGRHAVAVELIGQAIAGNRRVASYHGNLGVALQALGRVDEAATSLRKSVELDPTSVDGHYNLGVALQALDRHQDAVASYQRALRLAPGHLSARYNLGNALLALDQLSDAAAAHRAVLAAAPDHAPAQLGLGVALQRLGQHAEALAAFTQAVALNPNDAAALTNLGIALLAEGHADEAISQLDRAVRLAPDNANAWLTLSRARLTQGDTEAALVAWKRATDLAPSSPEALHDLGAALQAAGRPAEARICFENALALRPTYAEALYALGVVHQSMAQFDDAVRWYRQALTVRPDHAQTHNNLGNTLVMLGRLDEALVSYRADQELRPDNPASASNVLLARQYDPSVDRQTLAGAARSWNARFAAPLAAAARPHQNGPDPDRRLRIGYVSADFRRHPVSYFAEPILRAHDPAVVEVYCYANADREDELTARIRSSAQVWRRISNLDDEQAADLIRADEIDLLVDLSGHTAGHRLLTFARRPAPVQVSWLGYVDTTGLDAIDAVIADRFFCPPDDAWSFTEKVVRLPGVRWCYAGPDGAPPVSELPALRRGSVTFGCFNKLAKVTPAVIALWADVLRAVPGARLLLKSGGLDSPDARDRYLRLFAEHGIGGERLDLRGNSAHTDYLSTYAEVDIGLDPFPFNGGTVTAESLWMGVPPVTLRGDRPAGRMGAAQLSAIGLPELIAATPADYVHISAGLAANLPLLAALRRDLRARLQTSALGNVPAFTRDLEAAYRDLWRAWCGDRGRPAC
ncbi:MAG: tetratricopeptide repeat protein [Chloroflexi bacterium]|nr:tetratricopeptide repeat protein [Chloroflexota bacterium]